MKRSTITSQQLLGNVLGQWQTYLGWQRLDVKVESDHQNYIVYSYIFYLFFHDQLVFNREIFLFFLRKTKMKRIK